MVIKLEPDSFPFCVLLILIYFVCNIIYLFICVFIYLFLTTYQLELTSTITFQMQVHYSVLSLYPETRTLSSLILGYSIPILVAVCSHKSGFCVKFHMLFILVKKNQAEWMTMLIQMWVVCARLCKDTLWIADVICCQMIWENCHIWWTWKNGRCACGWFEN
jgi:hypothetical protein